MSLWDEAARELLIRTASADPTPGGGSVAALSGAFGLALVTMALAVTLRHQEQEQPDLRTLHAETTALLLNMQPHPDADVLAFQGYMKALSSPKATAEEKSARRTALYLAAQQATDVPLQAARDLHSGLGLAQRAATAVKREVVSDVGAGAALLSGALQAILFTVDINLGSLLPQARALAQAERERLAQEGQERAGEVAEQVAARLS
ncbi:cyclodeaminase/cyclohydrolase family protein [Deinococcus sp.]|uniref:cyclodeaminase/cyclohydrolase family protein n=1 Tax=Deinococcus sp. TaxID=47478 RepID=UPI003CC602A3